MAIKQPVLDKVVEGRESGDVRRGQGRRGGKGKGGSRKEGVASLEGLK